jgi:hypothetical protein
MHRCVLHVASARVARCMLQTRGRRVRCVVSAARVRCSIGRKAGLLRRPSGGAMPSCAVERWRARHVHGHRAVRRRGDIRHRSNGACGAGRMRVGRAGVGGRGATADCNWRDCAQWGGVVHMERSFEDGAVTFKGGSISNTKAAVRAPSASCASPRRGMVCCAVRHGRWMARTVRRTHAAASGVRSTAHAAGVESALYAASSCRIGACCIGASARVACCIGARCMLQSASACVARCIGACWREASVRVACCIGACRTLHDANARSCSPLCSVRFAARVRCSIGRKAGLLRRPSGGAMRSCAVEQWRALHDQGHCAVRRRGDIRHRSIGACGLVRRCVMGGCRRTGCDGRLRWARLRRLVRSTAAWCAWRMAPSRSRAARSRRPRR